MRAFYFVLTGLWGFVAGVGAVTTAIRMDGAEIAIGPLSSSLLVVGLALSVVGGLIAATAYRQARHRGRRLSGGRTIPHEGHG